MEKVDRLNFSFACSMRRTFGSGWCIDAQIARWHFQMPHTHSIFFVYYIFPFQSDVSTTELKRAPNDTRIIHYYTTAETNQNEITTAETTKTTMLFFNWKFVRVLFHNGKLCAIFAMHFIIIFLFHRQITREKIIKHFRGIYTCCSYTTCIEDHTIIYKWQHRNA